MTQQFRKLGHLTICLAQDSRMVLSTHAAGRNCSTARLIITLPLIDVTFVADFVPEFILLLEKSFSSIEFVYNKTK